MQGPDVKKKDNEVKTQHFDGSGLLGSSTGSKQREPPGIISSTELLSRMRQRNPLIGGTEPPGDGDTEDNLFAVNMPSVEDTKSLDMLTELRNFMAIGSAVNGMASTDELLAEFRDKVSPQLTATFKAMLNQIAILHKRNGRSLWKLKPVFR